MSVAQLGLLWLEVVQLNIDVIAKSCLVKWLMIKIMCKTFNNGFCSYSFYDICIKRNIELTCN